MISFLEKTAEHIIDQYNSSIENICIVLPNRRAGLFLRKHLSEKLQATQWSPQIQSIEDFIDSFAPMKSIDNISLLFELYEVHLEIEEDKSQSFDEFIKWGQVLLHDFNEIDTHLVDAKKVYTYLSDVKAIAHWSLDHKPLTNFQQNYISFFQSLYNYYVKLNERLSKKHFAYQGKSFKYVAQHIIEIKAQLGYQKIVFAGLNALTKAEEEIIFSLEKEGLAEILWDADEYYVNKAESGVFNEAGYFIRKYRERLKDKTFNWIENNFKTSTKQINIYGIPKMIGQAKFCGQLIQENQEILNAKYKSAVVLADENLIFPVLNSIQDAGRLNVTMGLPITSTPLYDFLDQWFILQQEADQLKAFHSTDETQFHQKNLLKLLDHTILQSFENNNELIAQLKKMNTSFLTLAELNTIVKSYQTSDLVNILLIDWNNNVEKALEVILSCLEFLKNQLIQKQKENNQSLDIEIEYVYEFVLIINRLKNYFAEYQSITNTKSFYSIFKQICKSTQISLYGEPLKGLQIMGMLESRSLDFEHLILMSVNENILPSSGKQNSFIPFDIKKKFGLPTYREKNAVFAYHFYRLIQRCKNVHLIYNTQADALGGGDKSRFLQQILQEIPSYNPSIQISEHIIATPLKISQGKSIKVKKNPEILNALKEKALKGFSPSSINTYNRCSLQFYFKEIAKLGESELNDDIIDPASFGNIVHESLYELYQDFINQNLTIEILSMLLKRSEAIVNKKLQKHTNSKTLKRGKNLLIANVAQNFVKAFIKEEIKSLKQKPSKQIRLIDLEKSFYREKSILLNDETLQVKFKGNFDRIDEEDNQIRIIDYKTGNVLRRDLELKNWEDLITSNKFEKCFQLLMYSWLYLPELKNNSELNVGIYSFKKLSQGFINLRLPEKGPINFVSLSQFEELLISVIKQIFDPQEYFVQTTELKTCEYCAYQSICKRN